MSLKSKRICKCCGKEYEYCPHCGSKSDEAWRNLTDTKECLAVFNIIAAYNIGRASADQVKKVLDENKITDYSMFKDNIVAVLDEICKPSDATIVKSVSEAIIAPQMEFEPLVEQPAYNSYAVRNEHDRELPYKNRNNKKKYRQRNTDIEL